MICAFFPLFPSIYFQILCNYVLGLSFIKFNGYILLFINPASLKTPKISVVDLAEY